MPLPSRSLWTLRIAVVSSRLCASSSRDSRTAAARSHSYGSQPWPPGTAGRRRTPWPTYPRPIRELMAAAGLRTFQARGVARTKTAWCGLQNTRRYPGVYRPFGARTERRLGIGGRADHRRLEGTRRAVGGPRTCGPAWGGAPATRGADGTGEEPRVGHHTESKTCLLQCTAFSLHGALLTNDSPLVPFGPRRQVLTELAAFATQVQFMRMRHAATTAQVEGSRDELARLQEDVQYKEALNAALQARARRHAGCLRTRWVLSTRPRAPLWAGELHGGRKLWARETLPAPPCPAGGDREAGGGRPCRGACGGSVAWGGGRQGDGAGPVRIA